MDDLAWKLRFFAVVFGIFTAALLGAPWLFKAMTIYGNWVGGL